MPVPILENPSAGGAVASNTVVNYASTTNVNIATGLVNTASFDGITLATGNIVLLKDQTNPIENGIYTVPVTGAAPRLASWAAGTDAFGRVVDVRSGSSATISYREISSPAIVGTNPLGFVPISAGMAATYGEQLLVTGGQQNLTATTVDVTGSVFTLPSAGTWEVEYVAAIFANASTQVTMYLTDSSFVEVAGSRGVYRSNTTTADTYTQIVGSARITTTGAVSYRLRASLTTGTAGGILVSGTNGVNKIAWKKIGGNAPMLGQTANHGLWVTKGTTSPVAATSGSNINFGANLIDEGGTGIAFNGINWTLEPGTYLLEADLQDGSNTTIPIYQFFNNTTNTAIGAQGQSRGTGASYGGEVVAKARISVSSPTSISLRALANFTVAANNSNVNSYVQIAQVGTNAIAGFPVRVNGSNNFVQGLYDVGLIKINGNFEFFQDQYLRLEMSANIMRWTSVGTAKSIGVYGFNSGSTGSSLPVTTDPDFIGVGGYSSTPVGTWQAIANAGISNDYDDIYLFWIQVANAPVKYRVTLMGGSSLCAIVERWDLSYVQNNVKITIN
jgi:hypothetical protein